MASENPPELRGTAPDEPHHPPNPNLNFIWLYATIGAVFILSVAVKIMTVIFKKRRDKKRDPDLERQQLEPFQKWWYPWRYNKKGERIIPPPSNTSDGTGESSTASSQPIGDTAPQLPPLAHHRESSYDRLVFRCGGNAADDSLASPPIMSGALSPNSISSPVQLENMDGRLHRAGMSDSASLLSSPGLNPSTTAASSLISDNTPKSHLPAVNPFTSQPFRSHIPRATIDRSDPGTYTAPARSASNATGHGYGRLSPTTVEGTRFNSDSFNDGQFGRSLAHEAAGSNLQSGLGDGGFAHGYGASRERRAGSASGPARSGGDRQEHHATESDKRRQVREPSKSRHESDRTPSSRDKPAKHRPSPLRVPSSQHTSSSSRTHSSQAASASAHNTPSSSSSGTPKKYSALGGGKFRNVVLTESKWDIEWREMEAERKRKEAEEAEKKRVKEAEEAGRKRKKAEEREARKKNGAGGIRDLVGAGKKPAK